MQQDLTLNGDQDPAKRIRDLEIKREKIWEQVIGLLNQANIITHELIDLKKEGNTK